MNNILLDALDRSRIKKMNPSILTGMSTEILKDLPETLDAVCRGIFNTSDSVLNYISMERVPPEEVVRIYYTKKTGALPYDIAESNLALYRLRFTFFGMPIERMINLVYLTRHNRLNLANTKRLINPVIMDKSISPSKDAVFIRILRQSITVYRSSTPNARGLIKSSKVLHYNSGKKDWDMKYDISVLHSRILSRADSDNTGTKITYIEPTVLHYLLAEYGFNKTMSMTLTEGVLLLPPEEAMSLSNTHYHKFMSAGMPEVRRLPRFKYIRPKEILCIPKVKGEDMDYVTNIAITWFYIMDGFPGYDIADLENTEIWKLLLGQIYRGNLNPGRIQATMDHHMASMRQHIDEYTANKLQMEFGDSIGLELDKYGFFSILVVILKNFKRWTLASESISSTTIGKYFEIEYYLLQKIIHSMNNLTLQIKKRDPQGQGDFRSIKTLVDKQILPRTIFSMREFNEITSTIEYSGDNLIFKVIPIVDLQLNTKATSKSKTVGMQRVIVDDPSSRLNSDMPIAGTMAVVKGKKLSPYYTLNPYCDYDDVKRTIKHSAQAKKETKRLEEILSRDQNRSRVEIPEEFLTSES